jgi:hypothetical protein
LKDVLPNALFRILKSPKLKVKSDNSKFDFVLGYLSAREDRSTFLFETIDFFHLSQSNLKRCFDFVQLSNFNETLFNSLKRLFIDSQTQNAEEVQQTPPK